MKRRNYFLTTLPAALLALAMSAGRGFSASPLTQEVPKSVFTLPSGPREGRDPFFPNSDRPYREYSASTHSNAPSASDLEVRTILRTADGRSFAIINNHTFAAGDDGDVLSKDGRRIHIHCLAINPKNNTVTVEAGGLTVTLTFAGVQ